MPGSRWVITPLWLSGSGRPFLYNSSVYSYHFFLISSASVRSIPFLSFIVPIRAGNVSLISLCWRHLKSLPFYCFPLFLCRVHLSSLGVAKSWTRLNDFTFTFSLSCIGEGTGNPLQCSCLENPRERGAWWAAVSGVTQDQTRLKQLRSSSSFCNCVVVWTFFVIAFLWDENKNWPFPVLWPLLSFPNLLAYWVQHFHSIII